MDYSKNQEAAKEFLRWMDSKPIFDQWFISQQGFSSWRHQGWEKHPVWDVDPVLQAVQRPAGERSAGGLCRAARPQGRRGAVSKYIIVDMYAKAIQGMPAEDAAKWAHGEVAKTYA